MDTIVWVSCDLRLICAEIARPMVEYIQIEGMHLKEDQPNSQSYAIEHKFEVM